jgi:hypothetical protein
VPGRLLNVPPNVGDPAPFIPPSTSFIVSSSKPIFPEEKTNPFALIAQEKTGSGAGTSEVCTSVMEAILCKDQDSLDVRLRDVKVKLPMHGWSLVKCHSMGHSS